jgi:hypothetical protein
MFVKATVKNGGFFGSSPIAAGGIDGHLAWIRRPVGVPVLSGCSHEMLVAKTAPDSRTAGAPEYGASAPSVVRRFSAGAIECAMAAGFRLLLAMNCQVAAGAADGTEVPYSGASGTMRQRAASRQPTSWDCTRFILFFDSGIRWAFGIRWPLSFWHLASRC